MVDRFPRVLAGQAWSESYRCLRAGRWPPRRSHRRRRRCRRRAWPPRRLRPPTARVRCSVAWRCRAWLAALPPVLPGHPIGSAAAPAVGAAAAAVEDLATEANIFVIPAMDD